MKISRKKLAQIINEEIRAVLLEWTPSSPGDLPPGFREPSDMQVQFIDKAAPTADFPDRRLVFARASKDGVGFQGDPVQYFAKKPPKMARMAYEKAVYNARLKHKEDQ